MVFARTYFLVPEFQRKNIGALGRNIIFRGSGTKKPRGMDTTSGRQKPGLHYGTPVTSTRIIEATEYSTWPIRTFVVFSVSKSCIFTIPDERKVSAHKMTI
jgi:hypothetical protein